ncbi:treacle protein isoform X2 [Ascaphus truei]|uniref:treacle protein isoform X2 n=1 Tax=Ascaphus truei TaxID=8439 RepID=UPI003F5A5E10
MENTELSLLSLIHQHLLHLGYYKAARELQLQSRKTFSSQSVSLQDIYTDWTQRQGSGKKRKASKANHDTAIKKPRVPDPVSSSETSEEEDKGKGGAAIAAKLIPAKGAPKLGSAENKKNAEKQAAKVKTASAAGKTMNSVTKAKNTPEMTSTPRQEKAAALHTRAPAAVMPESSETSDSDEEKTIPKTAPLPATLKPDLGLAESSDDSSSSDSEMDTVVQAPKAKGGKSEVAKSSPATPASGKLAQGKAASNGKVATPAKATVKPAANESSKTSDSADIAKTVKQKAPASQAKAAATATKVTTALTASQTKAAKIAASAKARAVTAAAPTSPQIGVTKGDVPGAVCTATAESSDTSGSEEDDDQMLIPTPKPAAPSPAIAKVKVQTPASIAAAGSGSESSESESEEEPGGQHKAVAALVHAPPGTALSKSTWTTPFKMKTETLEAKVSTTTNPAEDDGSESSDSSDSEEEVPVAQVATPKKAATVKAPAAKAVAGRAVVPAPVVKKPEVADDTESSASSDSEEEPTGQVKNAKVAPAQQSKVSTPASIPKNTATPTASQVKAAKGRVTTPAKAVVIKALPGSDSSDTIDSSDYDKSPYTKKLSASMKGATKAQTAETAAQPVKAAKGKTNSAANAGVNIKAAAAADESSDSSDSSDSEEEEPAAQKAAPAAQVAVKATPRKVSPKPAVTPTASSIGAAKSKITGPAVVKPTAADSSDSSDSSDSEEEPAAKAAQVAVKATPGKVSPKPAVTPTASIIGAAKSKATAPAVVKPTAADSSDSSDSSDSEEEPAAKKVTPAAQVAVKATPGKVSPKPAVTPTASSIGAAKSKATAPAVVKPTAADSSDSSDSSDSEEEPAAKKAAPAAQVAVKATPGKVSPKPAVTPTASSIGAAKSKATAPAVVKPTAADSSDSSDSSDSEEEPAAKKAAPAAQVAVKATPGKMSPKPAVTPTASSIGAAKSKATAPAVVKPTAADSSDSSDSSDSEEEPAAKTGPPAPVLNKTQPGKLVVLIPNAILAAPSTKPPAKAPRGKVAASAVVKTIADVSESSDSSDSEEEAAAQLATPTPAPIKTKPGKMATRPGATPSNAIKGKVAAPAKASIQDVSPAAGKLASSQTPVRKTGAGAAQNKLAALSIVANADSSSEDTSESELENSQLPLKQPVAAPSLPSMPSSRKRKRDKKTKDEQTSALGSAVRAKKKKRDSSTKTQPVTVAEIDSEEATMMALLAGSSPKTKKPTKSASKKKKTVKLSVAAAPILPVQNNNIPPKSGQLALELYSVYEPECPNSADKSDDDDDVTTINKVKSPAPTTAPLLLPQSAVKRKKSSKKKNLSQEDAIARLKAKLAKNAKKAIKKEKKLKLAAGGVENMSPKTKSSKKDKKKSEKSDKKTKKKKKALKKDKKKEKRDKTAHPLSGGIEGQNDPAIGLSKPKKKKKIKAGSAD